MNKKKQKSVASVSSSNGMTIGASDVIRYDDVMTVQGHDIKISKAVELGKKYGVSIADQLEKDLKSKTGLLITFPIAMLMSELQERLEVVESIPHKFAGVELTKLVKP